MGLVYSNFTLRNPRRELASVVIRALVDTGANTLCIPPALAAELELEEVEKRGVTLADGSKHWVPYVGPVQLSFGKRHSFGGAFVLGDEVLVGALPSRTWIWSSRPPSETVTVNPASPHIARGFAYGYRERT